MTLHQELAALGWMPFHVSLEQILPTSPVQVLWHFPVEHFTLGATLTVTSRVSFVGWS